MKATKIIAAIAALSLTGVMLTACGNNGGEAETSTATEVSASETTESAETAESEAETEAPAESGDTAETDASEDTEEDVSDDTAEDEEVSDDENADANPLKPLVDAATSAGEWPDLDEVTDTEIIKDYFTIDVSDPSFEQYVFMMCPMSANLSEVIIIKSTDVEAAKTALEGRQKKAQETDAFYPDDIERAGSSIVGTEGDYAYFIMCFDSADAETALVNAIKAL